VIVNQTRDGWEIIYHRAHALLAAQIASHWHRPERVERVAETIAAIAQHDDLEREWQGGHLTPAGAPLDFTLSDAAPGFVEPWRRLIGDARYRGRWVALLTAMHVDFLTAPQAGQDKALDAFRADLGAQIAAWRKELGVSKDEATRSYAFLQWCDRCSLILCQRQLPDRERRLEISPGPDGVMYELWQRADDGVVIVEPWPFREERLTVCVDACVLSQLQFASDDELTEALKRAPGVELTWELAGK
jgi:hypothetical protein